MIPHSLLTREGGEREGRGEVISDLLSNPLMQHSDDTGALAVGDGVKYLLYLRRWTYWHLGKGGEGE